jgi:hypothetical protein
MRFQDAEKADFALRKPLFSRPKPLIACDILPHPQPLPLQKFNPQASAR